MGAAAVAARAADPGDGVFADRAGAIAAQRRPGEVLEAPRHDAGAGRARLAAREGRRRRHSQDLEPRAAGREPRRARAAIDEGAARRARYAVPSAQGPEAARDALRRTGY